MEELRKAMTEKLLEVMRMSIDANIDYIEDIIDKYNITTIFSVVHERYGNILGADESYSKVNHDYIINNCDLEYWINMYKQFGRSDRELVMIDGVVRYLSIYVNLFHRTSYVRKHNDADSILKLLETVLSCDYPVFNNLRLPRYNKSDNLDILCSIIHKNNTYSDENIQILYAGDAKLINRAYYSRYSSSHALVTGILVPTMRDYLPDSMFFETEVGLVDRSYSIQPTYAVRISVDDMVKSYIEKKKTKSATINDLVLVNSLYDYAMYSKYVGTPFIRFNEISEDYVDIKVSMRMRVKADGYDELKSIEHHAEKLLDLDNWPEIEDVSDVHVDRIEAPSNLSFNTKYFDRESELAMRAMNSIFGLQSFGEKITDNVDQTVEPEIPAESTGANFYDILDEEK